MAHSREAMRHVNTFEELTSIFPHRRELRKEIDQDEQRAGNI